MAEFAQRQIRTQSSHLVGPAKPDQARLRHAHTENPLLAGQQAWGNQAVQRLLRAGAIQAKLTINEPGDQYEQEADQVAEQVMRMPVPQTSKEAAVSSQIQPPCIQRLCPTCKEELHRQTQEPHIQRMCTECEEEQAILQKKALPGHTPEATPAVESQANALQGGGQPLPTFVRAFFEPRFGYDFSAVRVHMEARAAESAQVVNARAYTVGRDIVFAAGQFAPGTTQGNKLLAHELTHVVQQTARPSSMSYLQRDFWDDEEEEEEEGGVLDWVSEQAEGAAEWASETGGEVVEWATETGGEVIDWVTETGGEIAETASSVWQEVTETTGSWAEGGYTPEESYAPGDIPYTPGQEPVPEGKVICDQSGQCLETRCITSVWNPGERFCYGHPVPMVWDVDRSCWIDPLVGGECAVEIEEEEEFEVLCADEEALPDSPGWCLDTDFSPITHPGERCYRRIIHPYFLDVPPGLDVPPALVCPSSDHICFRPDCSFYSSPDRAGLAESKTSGGQCVWSYPCVAVHIGADVIPETLEKLWHKIVG